MFSGSLEVMVARPQALVLTLLGRHVQHRDMAVCSATFIDVLDRLGVSEEAARSTLSRMVRRGFLARRRVGRRAYFTLTERTRQMLAEGERRIFELPPVIEEHVDRWTLLCFSIPEARRNDRHSLRVGLSWRGFGVLRDGLWIAPGEVDVAEIVDDLDVGAHVEAFVARATPPTAERELVATAWDLDGLRLRFHEFVQRWSRDDHAVGGSDLARQLRLITEWRLLLRDAPRLPAAYLPPDWPAVDAFALFCTRHEQCSEGAATEFAELLDALPASDPDGQTAVVAGQVGGRRA